jgi:hypothetical protein
MKPILCKGSMSVTASTKIAAIIQSVTDEFGTKAELFAPVVVRMDSRHGSEFDEMKKPGIYIFLHDDGAFIKVGKHHLNASKRALEHCRDNTTSKDGAVKMADFLDSEKMYLLVFALKSGDDLHWVLALEHFLEKSLNPKIRSVRNG